MDDCWHPDIANARDCPDGGIDAQTDAPIDTAADVLTCEDGSPCWATIGGLPPGCNVERATHPEAIDALEFAACGPGCLRAELGRWLPPNEEEGWRLGGGRALSLVSTDPSGLVVEIFTTTDGTITDAIRHPQPRASDPIFCNPLARSAGEGSVGISIDWVDWETPDAARSVRGLVLLSPAGELGARSGAFHEVREPDVSATRQIEALAVSDRGAAWEIHPAGRLQARIDGTVHELGTGAHRSHLFGDHVVFQSQDAGVRLLHWTPEDGTSVLVDRSPALTTNLASDGAHVGWIETSSTSATTGQLWVTPLSRTPDMLAPRMLAADVPVGDLRVGDGLIAHVVVADGAVAGYRVIDVESGEVREWSLPGEAHRALVLVSRPELVVITATAAGRTLYRLEPAALAVRR